MDRRRARGWTGAALVALALALACADEPTRPRVVLDAPPGVHAGIAMALDDAAHDLEVVTGEAPQRGHTGQGECRDRQIRVVVEPATAAVGLAEQAYRIHEERCGDAGRKVVITGGSPLATQWAIYDLLQRLGVRYFHPEATYYPEALEWPELPIDAHEAPGFGRRSMHAHRRHPIELSPPLDPAGVDMAAHQRRWIDWSVKMRQTDVDGWDPELAGEHARRRGFGRVAALNLANAQQGARPLLDGDDPRPEAEILVAAVDRAMTPDPGEAPPHRLEVQFNPSEFTEVDHARTVQRLTTITDHFSARYPGAVIEAINHGTHGEPRPPFGRRFFDLPALAPAALGVQVHPLMFYDLDRPAAGVYGNESYRELLRFIREEQSVRRIVYYPESSWWLTFDLPVPLFLAPVTIEARGHDIDLLRPYLAAEPGAAAGVVGHQLFTSGQEWGFWMVDYCVAQMTWDPGFTADACLDAICASFADGEVIRDVLDDVSERQVEDLRDPALLRLLVGSDDETEAGEAIGVIVHPLPPPPAEVLTWDDAAAAALAADLDRLDAMALDYHAWADRVAAALPAQSPAQAPWVREIADGLRVFALRAEHAVAVYDAVLSIRSGAPAAVAEAGLARARELTAAAREVIHRRELDYRYPAALTIAGDERGRPGALPNHTVYPFRVLSRTHRLFYWERPDAQLAALVERRAPWVEANASIVRVDEPLELRLRAADVEVVAVTWGDGGAADRLDAHMYDRPGRFRWQVSGRRGDAAVELAGEVAVVERRLVFPRGSLGIDDPPAAAAVDGLLPGLVIGVGVDGDGAEAMVVADPDAESTAPLAWWRRQGRLAGPDELHLHLTGLGDLVINDARIDLGEGEGPAHLELRGSLATDGLIDLLLASGAFDRPGARALLADLLGLSAATLPASLPARAHARALDDGARPG